MDEVTGDVEDCIMRNSIEFTFHHIFLVDQIIKNVFCVGHVAQMEGRICACTVLVGITYLKHQL
jgi:hypothetical protein